MIKWLVVVMALFVGGCLPATQMEVQELTGTVAKLISGVDDLQDASKELAKHEIVSAEKLDKINEEIDTVQEDLVPVLEAVSTADDPLDAVKKGWDASEPFNPYYTHGALVLTVLGLFFKNKKTKTALEEVVVGVDDMLKDEVPTNKAPLKAAESIATRKMVAKIRSNA
jgi:hypothetical protein